MKNSVLLTIIAVSPFTAVLCATLWDKNVTTTLSNVNFAVPFPGIGWLERIATLSTEYRSSDGTLYSSVYDAILSGAPMDHPCQNFNAYLNSVFIPPRLASWVVDNIGGNLFWGHYILCYLRNFVAAMLVYYGTASIFHYHCYVHPRSKEIFANRTRPSWETIWDQIKLAQASLFLYTLLPVLDEYLVESGWTQVYHTIDDIGGWLPFCLYTLLYFSLVEIGIYWMHRTLHTNKFLYKHVHMLHHKYNRAETLTPWCSIAFHPLDGILQASPYVIALFFVPCHYGLHVLMLFFTAIWATYIHDAMDFNLDPIMGSKYHTVHHTHYIYNYGQVFTFCDKFWGTLKIPEGPTGVPSSKRSKLEPTSRMINKMK